MPIILSIETSTKACSAAIHHDGKLLSVSELYNEKSSSGMLTTLIEHVVKTASLKLQDIDAIAVAKGPGSYTGLRIGVSTAKGLCFILEKPLIAINTLEAMAYQLSIINYQLSILLCPMLDARRMEVYCAVYKADTLEVVESTQAKIIDETSFADLLENRQIIFFGDGAEKCRATLGGNPNAVFLNQIAFPSAKSIGALATRAFEQQQFENVADFEPFYLKEFVGTTPKKTSL
ncbi:tRNA (adenosine(37)-N6)-threonylcarbamoyltransferase complex dimerization subunit type 1 TsaB [Emticicia oligotrophica]|uniref:tRNA (adenosine(37)-N6)-threonylcarbamoyltransferase complex dimerization subunit type 1 TsaB n=1 Tax=Emticicia oligotrophica TaxID=312279 RepID=UPI00273CCF8F|nr:tRNA (adenosine(37)-N6)-threonylcarbamoyltransferase complex dimerization subunit type 1 TsaB [Emticicia oligotrophica]